LSKKRSKKKSKVTENAAADKIENEEVKENVGYSEIADTKTQAAVLTEEKSDDENFGEKKDSETQNDEKSLDIQPKPILPRKRKIVKNNQLIIVFCITVAAVLTAVIWSVFFNRDITGTWYYVHTGEYTDSSDVPSNGEIQSESVTHTYTQQVSYNFDDDGVCTVSLGSMSVKGPYQLLSLGSDPTMSVGVYYESTPLLYGNYHYKISGNLFTGRKITLFSDNSDDSQLVLERGEGSFSLERFENEKLDERLYGRWKNPEFSEYFTFKDDGHMIIEIDNTIVIDHVYTVMDEGILLTKYETDSQQSFSYSYSFDDDGNFILNGAVMEKAD